MHTCFCSEESVEVCDDGAGNDAAAISTECIHTSELLMDIMRESESKGLEGGRDLKNGES